MSTKNTTITLPALLPRERIEIHATESEVEWTCWGHGVRAGCASDIHTAAAALTAAIQQDREDAKT